MTIDTGASVTIVRPDIVAGRPERKPSRAYVLQTASGETLPMLREALVELTLGQRALSIWVFVAEVTDEFILGLDVLRAYDASVDLGRHLLRLGQEEVTLWRPGAQPKSARLSLVGDEVIPARCERVVVARLEAPLGATNLLIEPSQKGSRIGVFIARTLVRARPRVPVRIMNVTSHNQVLRDGTDIGHGEPAVWAATIDYQKPEPRRKRGLCKQLREVIVGARPTLSVREAQALEELMADYQDVFETKSGDHGRTDKVYHRIDTGDARPIRQPPRRLPLLKQAEVNGMLEDMKSKGVIEESVLGHRLWCPSGRKTATFASASTTED